MGGVVRSGKKRIFRTEKLPEKKRNLKKNNKTRTKFAKKPQEQEKIDQKEKKKNETEKNIEQLERESHTNR
ncbi:hypothetical protein ACFFYR_36785 [Paraburkholderia dipogonis]|uniref:hypothetical protein n=1 Tax=Paraburkholderia dipogonis TaxID=1211383 RepID=UPI0035E70D01